MPTCRQLIVRVPEPAAGLQQVRALSSELHFFRRADFVYFGKQLKGVATEIAQSSRSELNQQHPLSWLS